MNALPELKPITIAVLKRPAFDNTHLGDPPKWQDDNAEKLARYHHAMGQSLGFTEEDEADFNYWLLVQHDIEAQRNRRDHDPTPWCTACGARTKERCHCGPIAENE